MVSERSLDVLRAIVSDYVASREPVGSKSIVERHSFGVSAATIRNDMALLEEEELIVAPHTSSGRIPTDKGYRLFVDHLAEVRPLSGAQRQAIETFLDASADLDDVLARTVRLVSQLTNQVALIQYPSRAQAALRHIELVTLAPNRVLSVVISDTGQVDQRVIDLGADVEAEFVAELRAKINTALEGQAMGEACVNVATLESLFAPERAAVVAAVVTALREQLAEGRKDRLIIAGAANLVRTEEDFHGNILPVLEAVEEQVVLLKLFGEMQADQRGMSVSIGRENEPFGLAETSVLATGYSGAGGTASHLGVLGPTRMDYGTNMAVVRAVARYLSHTIDG